MNKDKLIPELRFPEFEKEWNLEELEQCLDYLQPTPYFVENIMSRMIFDGEKLTDLLAPLDLSWKERRVRELALMNDLVPQLKKLAGDREISGLKAYTV